MAILLNLVKYALSFECAVKCTITNVDEQTSVRKIFRGMVWVGISKKRLGLTFEECLFYFR